MKEILVILEKPGIEAIERDKEEFAKAYKIVEKQIDEGISQVTGESNTQFGLIIDGKSLIFALDKNLIIRFMELAMKCATVICCRSSPKQKAIKICRLLDG